MSIGFLKKVFFSVRRFRAEGRVNTRGATTSIKRRRFSPLSSSPPFLGLRRRRSSRAQKKIRAPLCEHSAHNISTAKPSSTADAVPLPPREGISGAVFFDNRFVSASLSSSASRMEGKSEGFKRGRKTAGCPPPFAFSLRIR